MKLNKSPRTDQHPSCTGSVLPASRILLQSTESAGQKEMPCKTHSNIYSSYLYTFLTFIQAIYIPLSHLFKLFIYLSHIYSSYLYTFQTCIQAIHVPFKQFTQIIHTAK